ncbi:MAG: UDP-glucose/GDP-mannose dehydrogenase family protein [Candidatus Omnitrophica bacterium]|nr:UDP-glucose/GDP-mannose dehydrogenase family protein [Candidatus Omnitrophota bacterium]
MNVGVIGAGYVGLTTAVCLAEIGHKVICVDNDKDKLEKLNRLKVPIFEPGIEELLERNFKEGRLKFSDDIGEAVKFSQIIFICVNTPPKEGGFADLKYVEKVARDISSFMGEDYKVIVDKSTVPVKTAEKVKETIIKYSNKNVKFDVVSNPEFLKEGSAIHDTMYPDRIVIGVESEMAKEKMLELYKPIINRGNVPVKIVSVRSAELIKHGANTFLSLKISFANLIAEVCDAVKADAKEVLEAIGLDSRIGSEFLNPGIGFGGSCFPKDILAFKKTLEILGIDCSLVESIEKINERSWRRFLQRIEKELWVLDGKVIGVLGLSFKPNTDDIRNSPALKIIEVLLNNRAKIKAYDPKAMDKTKKIFPNIEYCSEPYAVAKDAEALLICTDWDEFKHLDLKKIKELMLIPIIFDGRNVFERKLVKSLGFKYFSVGR